MKKIISTIITAVMAISLLIGSTATADSDIRVTLNGTQIQFDSAPVIQSGRTLVPIRAIFEAMGMSVSWDNNTKKILAVGDNGVITMEIGTVMLGYGSSEGNIELHPMDVAPTIINDRTYVPARYVAEATGYNVDWDNASRTVIISGEARKSQEELEPYEVKGSLAFYDNFPYAIDFGKLNSTECTGVSDKDTSYTYNYITTGADVVNYIYAIKAQGFEMEDTNTIFGLTMMDYKKGDNKIHISYSKSDNECSITLYK